MLGLLEFNVLALILIGYFAEYYYYQGSNNVRRNLERLVIFGDEEKPGKVQIRKSGDMTFAVAAFLRTWLEIVVCVLLIGRFEVQYIICFALSVVIAGRIRALQELSHFAVHCALGGSPRFELHLANVFFQFPFMRVDARARRRLHVAVHHRNSNLLGRDPNLDDLKAAGIEPSCGAANLLVGVFNPLLPLSVLAHIRDGFKHCFEGSVASVGARLAMVFGLAALTYVLAGWVGVLFGLLVPRFVIYPWLSWLSQLLEHKWYAPMLEHRPYFREFGACRRTSYGPIVGPLLRYFVLPFGDSYHLAHSLFPRLRWNYLPYVDEILENGSVDYAKGSSVGLLKAPQLGIAGSAFGWLWTISKRL